MLESALKIMMFMWAVSFSVLGGQYIIGDAFGIELVNFNGEPIKSHIVALINEDEFNERSSNIATGNFQANTTTYDRVETFTTGAAFVAWELITLLSGTYIFNFLFILGIPPYFVSIFVILYILLLGRAIIGYIRGI